ncbi:Mitochondrial outer membrane protein porin [Nymphaea thermarum]|nr:Mitochondrial outer membrane protein porin [Nymphaea thermarum]
MLREVNFSSSSLAFSGDDRLFLSEVNSSSTVKKASSGVVLFRCCEEDLGAPSLGKEDPDSPSLEEEDLGTFGLDDGGLSMVRRTHWARAHCTDRVGEAQADLGEVELQYFHDHAGISTSIGLTANPIVKFSGVLGSSVVALGTDVAFDTATGNFTMYNAGLSYSNTDLIASLNFLAREIVGDSRVRERRRRSVTLRESSTFTGASAIASPILYNRPGLIGLTGRDNRPKPGRNSPTRYLTPQQMEELRRKGLCFRCEEKWDKNHQCKSFHRLQLVEDSDTSSENDSSSSSSSSSEEEVEVKKTAKKEETPKTKIKPEEVESFHSLTDPYKPNAMRVFGRINGHQVLILLDSGATNNFLTVEAVARCKAAIKPSKPQTIKVGDGYRLRSEHEGKDIEVVIKKKTFKIDLLVFPLDEVDLVLGMPWFFTLGVIAWDARNISMTFTPDGNIESMTLDGLASTTRPKAALRALELEQSACPNPEEAEPSRRKRKASDMWAQSLQSLTEVPREVKGAPEPVAVGGAGGATRSRAGRDIISEISPIESPSKEVQNIRFWALDQVRVKTGSRRKIRIPVAAAPFPATAATFGVKDKSALVPIKVPVRFIKGTLVKFALELNPCPRRPTSKISSRRCYSIPDLPIEPFRPSLGLPPLPSAIFRRPWPSHTRCKAGRRCRPPAPTPLVTPDGTLGRGPSDKRSLHSAHGSRWLPSSAHVSPAFSVVAAHPWRHTSFGLLEPKAAIPGAQILPVVTYPAQPRSFLAGQARLGYSRPDQPSLAGQALSSLARD